MCIRDRINAAICSDHPENPIQYLPLAAQLCHKAGLPYDAALRSITVNAARITGIDKWVGSLSPGKDADLLIFKNNPLDVMEDPLAVMVNGNFVKGGVSHA